MNDYKKMKDKHQKEINEFPMFFAFNNKQFDEGMKKLGLDPSEEHKIYKLGNTGGFYRKTDATKLNEMFKRHEEEIKKAMAEDDDFVFEMFNYELGNHEYIYTQDITDTLNALGLTIEEVRNDKRLLDALQKACKAQEDWHELNREK